MKKTVFSFTIKQKEKRRNYYEYNHLSKTTCMMRFSTNLIVTKKSAVAGENKMMNGF